MKKFNPGDVIVFDPQNFNPEFWNNLSEKDRIKYYGELGYGQKKIKLFVYVCPINSSDGHDSGHHIMVDLDDGKNHVMRHTTDFRLATEEEW